MIVAWDGWPTTCLLTTMLPMWRVQGRYCIKMTRKTYINLCRAWCLIIRRRVLWLVRILIIIKLRDWITTTPAPQISKQVLRHFSHRLKHQLIIWYRRILIGCLTATFIWAPRLVRVDLNLVRCLMKNMERRASGLGVRPI